MTGATVSGGLRRGPSTWLMYGGLGYLNFLVSAIGPALPLLRTELGMSYTVASLHYSAFAVGLILSGTLTDRVAGWVGRGRTFWSSIAGVALGGLGVASAGNAANTIGGTLAIGLFGGAPDALIRAAMPDGGPVAVAECQACRCRVVRIDGLIDVVGKPHDDAVVEPDASLAGLGNPAVGGRVETDVVERTGDHGDADRGESGAAAVEMGVVLALSRGERSDDQPDDEHRPSGPHRYLR
jgi:hypothetical protein